MSTYSKLQKTNRYLKNELTGVVVLGTDGEENLKVLSLDPEGNLKIENGDIAKEFIAFGEIVDPLETVKLGSLPVTDSKFAIKTIIFTGNGLGELTLKIGGVPILVVRNSYFEQTKEVTTGFQVEENQEVELYVRNTTFQNNTNAYEAYILYG